MQQVYHVHINTMPTGHHTHKVGVTANLVQRMAQMVLQHGDAVRLIEVFDDPTDRLALDSRLLPDPTRWARFIRTPWSGNGAYESFYEKSLAQRYDADRFGYYQTREATCLDPDFSTEKRRRALVAEANARYRAWQTTHHPEPTPPSLRERIARLLP